MDPADRLAIRLTTAPINAALEARRALAAEARATQRLVDELAQRQAQLRREGQQLPRMGRCPSIGPASSPLGTLGARVENVQQLACESRRQFVPHFVA
jgi:hypothetical protein